MRIFVLILKETIPESGLVLVSKIDYFRIRSMVHVYFQVFNALEEEGYRSIESFVV